MGSNRILVTGAAGFIGFHAAKALLERGDAVLGVDNFNDYYFPELKEARVQKLGAEVRRLDLLEAEALKKLVEEFNPTHVLHLAAQAGVRYSLENPQAYIQSNIVGFVNLLEALKSRPDVPLVYASSSSVYGLSEEMPLKEGNVTDRPVSLYGATKKADEAIAHAYHHLYGMRLTGLRYFTVYGPWGRPDMAYYKFARAIDEGKPIDVYNHGALERDFTYIDDIIAGTVAALDLGADFEIFNLGNHRPVTLLRFIEILEEALGKKAVMNMLPMQPGDVKATFADIEKASRLLDFAPRVPLEEGLKRFVEWWRKR